MPSYNMGRPKRFRQIDKQWWVITEQDRNARERIGVDPGSDDIVTVGIIKSPNVDGSATGGRERRRGAVRCVMSIKNMIPLAQGIIVAPARTCRIAPKIRHKIDPKCLNGAALSQTHVASNADAPFVCIGINGTIESVVELGRQQQVGAIVVDRSGNCFADRNEPCPFGVATNEVVSSRIKVDPS